MKKTILIILILCAIPLYSYNIYLLIHSPDGNKNNTVSESDIESFDSWILKASAVTFTASDRDPFSPYKKDNSLPVEKVQQQEKIKELPKKVIPQPSMKITGIMWSSTNPVAMVVLPNGSSTVVKQGGIYNDITVKKIEKSRLQIVYMGQTFFIEK
jgi:type II secretory pathway component PulC